MTAPKINTPNIDLGGDVQKFINDVVDTGKTAVSDTSNFINRSGAQLSDGVRDGVAGAAQNFERNTATQFNNVGRAFKGDFTGFDRTLIDATLYASGLGAFANPDDVSTITGTTPGQQQLNVRAEQEAQAQLAADAAAKEAERLAGIRDVITGQVAARARAPGRSMVFSTGGTGAAYTLLTPMGK